MADPRKMEEGQNMEKKGDELVEEEQQQQLQEQQQPLVKQKTKRVATLDAFRGLTIVVSHKF